jgi:pimeloyl-ACP methyl ester carboxylesterase
MTQHSHQTAPTQFVEANGIRFAYRRFGKAPDFDPELFLDGIDPEYWAELNRSIGGVPLVFNQHFTGTMDHWDPAVTDGLAKGREVILFNNAGVSSSSGEVPTTFEEMGANAIAFIKALGLTQVDVLGFSIGGFVAQEITLQAPDLVRRLVLVGTGPRGGQNMASLTPEAQQIFGATYKAPEEIWLKVHFTDSEASQAAGREFLKRFLRRTENRDPDVNEKVAPAQIEAIGKWGVQREGSYEYLKTILQPTLVVNGDTDVIIYSINSWILQQNIPDAQLIIYPDANHGSPYQYPERFVRHVSDFLSEYDSYVSDFLSEDDAAAPAVFESTEQSGS